MFEIKYRDAGGRIGRFTANGKTVETPLVLPVINPRKIVLEPKEIEGMGFEGIIANSYIIHKDEKLKKGASEKGLHKLLGFKGLIMTDSGSFQLSRYGDIDVSQDEIVKFQKDIGSDIGVMLDIPTPPDVSREKAEKDLNETLKRARKIDKILPLAGTVQGSTYLDLRENSAKELAGMDFDIYPIGAVVPFMESYRFEELVDVVLHSKKYLPQNKPVHLFGCGHPMIFSLAVAMGCDIFDSAAYALFAREDRYITVNGTLNLGDMYELPCSCEVCSNYTPNELLDLEKREREKLLAKHNLFATLEEIKRIKQSIRQGSLWELAAERCRSHPSLLKAFFTTLDYDFTKLDPVTKNSAFFYTGEESLKRPEVKRHWKKLENLSPGRNIIILPESERPYSKSYNSSSDGSNHACILSSIFGIIPLEVEDIYPLIQHEPFGNGYDEDKIKEYLNKFSKIYVHKDLYDYIEKLGFKPKALKTLPEGDDDYKVRSMLNYNFGRGTGNLLPKVEIERSRSGRVKHVYDKELLFTIRARDGFPIPTIEGGKKLLNMSYPKNRVVVNEEAEEFARKGRDIFAKFVVDSDPEIEPYQEVVVVNEKDEILATGKVLLNSEEMKVFDRGTAVKTRHSLLTTGDEC